jgi:hypothetical protein
MIHLQWRRVKQECHLQWPMISLPWLLGLTKDRPFLPKEPGQVLKLMGVFVNSNAVVFAIANTALE